MLKSLFIALALLLAPTTAEELNRVTQVRVGQHGQTTRLVIETARTPDPQLYLRTRPDRIVLDLLNTTLPDGVRRATPGGAWLASSSLTRENLSRVRWTLTPRQRVPLSQIKMEVLENPPRVVLDIDPYYDREDSYQISDAMRWVRRETAGPEGYLLWNEVAFDPNDTRLRLDVGLAEDKLDAREKVTSIVRRTGARVGINGGYFSNAGGPLGLVVKDGKILSPHVGRRPPRTAVGLTHDRKVKFSRIAARGAQLVAHDGSVWTDVVLALGGGPQLLRRGAIALTTELEGLGKGGNDITRVAGRTAVATTRDGKMLLVTASGYRDNHSQGLRLESLANRLLRRGASEAMNLDGGGSVEMVIGSDIVSLGPGAPRFERPVATALLIHDTTPARYPDRIQLAMDSTTLPADGQTKVRVVATVLDPSGNPVADGTPIRFWSERLGQSVFATTLKDGKAEMLLGSRRIPGPAALRVECGGAKAEELMRQEAGVGVRLLAELRESAFMFPDRQEVTVVAQVDDSWGNAIAGAQVLVEGMEFRTNSEGVARLAVELPLKGGVIHLTGAGLNPVELTVPAMEPPMPSPTPTPKSGK